MIILKYDNTIRVYANYNMNNIFWLFLMSFLYNVPPSNPRIIGIVETVFILLQPRNNDLMHYIVKKPLVMEGI
jgi:hypothetical protein